MCYNDSVFTPADLAAISRIGQDSKLERPAAVGRFGLGFNAVYHFTDIPSFVSGDYLVFFDPHATNLPGATPSQPGLKIRFKDADLLHQFPDQFQPYLQVPFQRRDEIKIRWGEWVGMCVYRPECDTDNNRTSELPIGGAFH